MCSASQFLLVYIKMNLLRLYVPSVLCDGVPYSCTRVQKYAYEVFPPILLYI